MSAAGKPHNNNHLSWPCIKTAIVAQWSVQISEFLLLLLLKAVKLLQGLKTRDRSKTQSKKDDMNTFNTEFITNQLHVSFSVSSGYFQPVCESG